RRLAPQLDQLCIQADTVVDMCRQRPIPVNRLKAGQYQLKVDTLTMQQIARPSLAFGPLAMAFFRDTFSLESLTLTGMAEEHARAYHVFRTRGEENYRRLEGMFSHDPKGGLYARTIG
ncbi:MAG TPA: hypothetical protein VLA60_09460, partial [Nitrospirales bacterium]|nr:hypothetical protein [Nitrospirales bacterium]